LKTKTSFSWPLLLCWLVLTELVLGGGGRWMSMGPLSPRMILFGLVQLTVLYQLISGKWNWKIPFLPFLAVFFGITTFSALWGWQQGASLTAVFTDVKPLLFWANLAFFAYVFSDLSQLSNLRFLFKWTTFGLAVSYLALLLFWQLNWIDAEKMYRHLALNEEFSFRGNLGFMYKGFVFLPVGMFFWLQEKGYRKYFVLLLLYLAVLFTFTRGFWAILFFIHIFYTLVYRPGKWVNWVAAAFMLVSVYAAGLYVASQPKAYFKGQEAGEILNNAEKLQQSLSQTEKEISGAFKQGFEHREASILDRFIQIRQVAEATTPLSLVMGHGFGHGIASRPVHMEITYLEVFHKQGLAGLGLWIWLFLALVKRFYIAIGRKIRAVDASSDSFVFFASACFMFGISCLNPFINAPMGLGMLALSLIVLEKLSQQKETAL